MPASRILALAAILLAPATDAAADPMADFYAGKTIKLTIPTPPGASSISTGGRSPIS